MFRADGINLMKWRNMTRRAPAALLPLLFFLACAATPERQMPPGRYPEPGRNLLWEIRSPTGTLYLLGSVHVGDPTLYPLSPPIERAFALANKLAVEVDVEKNPGETSLEALKFGVYQDGRSLPQILPNDVWLALDEEMRKYGLSAASFMHVKPWFVALMIINLRYEKTNYSAEYGVDRHFLRRARGRVPIVELESAALQMDMFNLLSDELQVQFLRDTLDARARSVPRLEEIVGAWRVGDDQKLETYLFADDPHDKLSQALRKIVFDDRNFAMAAKIEEYLKSGDSFFVVVGAGHLLGPTGIVTLLGQRGYSVRRL